MNVAIVGGAGFIGRHTARELISHGHTVTILDNNLSNCHGFFSKKEIKSLQLIFCDALDYRMLKSMLSYNRHGFDAVYMLAAISDSKENLADIPHAVNTNVMCLANTLEAANNLKIPRIIFSSTVWVYSISPDTRVNEESPLHINSSDHVYTTCKVACEALVRNFCAVKDIDYTILRYGIAYGPGCHPDTVMSRFITNAITGVPLTITGDGNIYRNFLNVDDHAKGNYLALCDGAKNETINLEGPEKITLTEVAERVKELHSGDATIEYTGQRYGDYKGKAVDNKKAAAILGWKPTIDFKTGSKTLYEYIKKDINNSAACG